MPSRILSVLFSYFLFIALLGCQTTQKSEIKLKSTTESVIIDILGELHSQEIHGIKQLETNNVDKFISTKLLASLLDGSPNTEWNEFVVSGDHIKNLHIGVLKLTYSTPKNTISALNNFKESGFLTNSKILTPYSSKATEQSILVVYSETFMHPDRKHVMSQLLVKL